MFNNREEELKLVRKIKEGNDEAWKNFVLNYSNLIFSAIRQWCQPYCRKFYHGCPWNISSSSFQGDTCNEVMDMYLFSLEAISKRIVKFRGESRLSTFTIASMKYIKLDYFREKYGRLQIPLVIKKGSKISHDVYKLLCRGKEKEDIAGKLNISLEEVKKMEKEIREKLREKGQEWEHLDGWIALKSEPQPIIIEGDDDIIDVTPPYEDISPEEREISECLIKALEKLSPVQKRLLQLRFQKRLSVGDIASKYLRVLNISNEKQIYKEIDEALTDITKFIKSYYDLKEDVTQEMKKYVKELLEKLMLSDEEKNDLSA
jgi:DNA-directed RNA polymerase specialized sigma subunit